MKKLLSAFLALLMALTLAAPALAFVDVDPPLWQQWGYASYEELISDGYWTEEEYQQAVEDTRAFQQWGDAYKAAHPDEVAAFDADAYFTQAHEGYWTKEEYMETFSLETEEAFQNYMMDEWLSDIRYAEQQQAEIDAYKAAHPDEVAAFDANAYFDEKFSDYWSDKEEYMSLMGVATEEEFYNSMLRQYIWDQNTIQEYKDKWAALQAAESERTAQFQTELNSWLKSNYYCKSFEQYVAQYPWYSCDEEAYLNLYAEWNATYEAEQEAIRTRNSFITERGGVPGTLGVMLDGKYLAFPEGRAPYAKNGATYADAATLSTILGMDIPSPIDGYVSIRTAAEKAGLSVFWDKTYQTVVLIDVAALSAKIDQDFTIYNSVLASWKADLTKNYKSGVKLRADVTAFDSLDGDKTGSMTFNMDMLYSAKGAQITGKYDMAKLMGMLLAMDGSTDYLDQEDLDQIKSASAGSFELRMDFEQAIAYLKASILDLTYPEYYETYVPGAWVSVPLTGLDMEELLSAPAPTYGSTLCGNMDMLSNWLSAATLYDDTLATAERAKGVLGDDCFTKSGSSYTLTLDAEDYAALSGSTYYLPEQFDLALTIRTGGGVSGKLTYRDEGYGYYSPATRVTADFDISFANQKMTLEIHARNTYKVDITVTGTTSVTNQSPETAPPKGATVVDTGV